MMKTFAVSFCLVSAALLPGWAFGQSTFTGDGDGTTWNDASNWDAGVPAGVNANIGDTFTVNLATDQTINEFDLVGDQNAGSATLNHSAGTLTSSGWVKVGGQTGASNGTGTYNLSGSASSVGQTVTHFGFNGGEGTLTVADNANFGTLGVDGVSENEINFANGNSFGGQVGDNSTAALNVSGNGTVNAHRINFGGPGSTATVNQSGGAVTSNSWVALGNFGAGGTTTYDISDGSLTANDGNLAIGQEGEGILNISGTAVVSQAVVNRTADTFFVAQDSTSNGELNIEGSMASVSGADFRVARDAGSTASLSWTADSSGITSIVSADNTEFGDGTATLSLDLTADSNSSVNGTEYLLVNNSAAVSGTFTGLAEGATVDLGGGNNGTISYAGGLDGFDIVVTAGDGGGLTGDFDNDGDVDLADLDRYIGNLDQPATGELADLDLNDDGQVTSADFETHYSSLVETSNGGKGTFQGDLNLDGKVDIFGDGFVFLANIGNAATSWADGDFNADGQIDIFGDGFPLLGNIGEDNGGGAAAAPSTTAVPEPTSIALLGLVGVGLASRRKKTF